MRKINYEIGEIIPYQQTNCLQLVECATCTGCIFDHGQCERPNFLPTCTPNKNIYKQVTDPQILDYRKYRRIYYDISNTDSYDEIIQNLIKLGGTISEKGIKQEIGYYYINAYGIISYCTERPEKYVRYTLSDAINNMPNPEFVKNYYYKINSDNKTIVKNKLIELGGLFDIDMEDASYNTIWINDEWQIYASESTDTIYNWTSLVWGNVDDLLDINIGNGMDNPEKEISTQTNKITDLKLKSMDDLKQNQEGTAQKQSMFKIMFDKMKTQFAITKEENLRLAADGSICVPVNDEYIAINASNKLVSYPSNLCVNCPIFVMAKPFTQIMVGDIIKDKESFYKVISKKENGSLSVLSYTGTMKNKIEVKDFLLNSAFAKVVINMYNSMGNNSINPMMLAMMNESENGNKTDMKEMMMLMMMMGGNNPFAAMSGNNTAGANPMMNPMMMMAMMGDNSNQSSMMEMFMMSQMMGGNNMFNPTVVSQSPVTKKKRRCTKATSASPKPTVK